MRNFGGKAIPSDWDCTEFGELLYVQQLRRRAALKTEIRTNATGFKLKNGLKRSPETVSRRDMRQ